MSGRKKTNRFRFEKVKLPRVEYRGEETSPLEIKAPTAVSGINRLSHK